MADYRTYIDCSTGEVTKIKLTEVEQAEVDAIRAADTGEDPELPQTDIEKLSQLLIEKVPGVEAADVALALGIDAKRVTKDETVGKKV